MTKSLTKPRARLLLPLRSPPSRHVVFWPQHDNDLPPLLGLMGAPEESAKIPNPKMPTVPGEKIDGRRFSILTGEAGELLTASRLASWNIPAPRSAPGSAYDLTADLGHTGSFKIQVKSCADSNRNIYHFEMHRGFHRSAHGQFQYQHGDFDIAAYVVLALDRVIFWPWPIQSLSVSRSLLASPNIQLETWQKALEAIKKRRNVSKRKLAEQHVETRIFLT